jgi:hypothetical protein
MSIGKTLRPSAGVRQYTLVWVEGLDTIRHSSLNIQERLQSCGSWAISSSSASARARVWRSRDRNDRAESAGEACGCAARAARLKNLMGDEGEGTGRSFGAT